VVWGNTYEGEWGVRDCVVAVQESLRKYEDTKCVGLQGYFRILEECFQGGG